MPTTCSMAATGTKQSSGKSAAGGRVAAGSRWRWLRPTVAEAVGGPSDIGRPLSELIAQALTAECSPNSRPDIRLAIRLHFPARYTGLLVWIGTAVRFK